METGNIPVKQEVPLRSLFPGGMVRAAVSGRGDGNMSLSYGDTQYSLRNRRDFLSGLGINYEHAVAVKQPHSGVVRYVDTLDRGRGADSYTTAIPDADALVTDKKHVPLVILTADCPSIFLYDSKTPAIGLVHAGWKGTKEKITENSVQFMRHYCGTKPGDISVFFGPAIRKCCYEVGEEFRDFFPYETSGKDGRLYLDLVLANKKQLLDAGVGRECIRDCGICTGCNPEEYFSYRKQGCDCGRFISVFMLA
ncbi:MAG: peptidoglycan editing factor PgeF [Candidatus Omnitrophica bacterium]|nr:peptidoglycan editing factor PgeF [Candidatus Omnitrophota bacterium]